MTHYTTEGAQPLDAVRDAAGHARDRAAGVLKIMAPRIVWFRQAPARQPLDPWDSGAFETESEILGCTFRPKTGRFWSDGGVPTIYIRHDLSPRDGAFAAAHELVHVFRFIRGASPLQSEDEAEEEANAWATSLLSYQPSWLAAQRSAAAALEAQKALAAIDRTLPRLRARLATVAGRPNTPAPAPALRRSMSARASRWYEEQVGKGEAYFATLQDLLDRGLLYLAGDSPAAGALAPGQQSMLALTPAGRALFDQAALPGTRTVDIARLRAAVRALPAR